MRGLEADEREEGRRVGGVGEEVLGGDDVEDVVHWNTWQFGTHSPAPHFRSCVDRVVESCLRGLMEMVKLTDGATALDWIGGCALEHLLLIFFKLTLGSFKIPLCHCSIRMALA